MIWCVAKDFPPGAEGGVGVPNRCQIGDPQLIFVR